MTTRYELVDGILFEPVGHVWATFSPATGETSLLNDESVSILEVLGTGPADTIGVCAALVENGDESATALEGLVAQCWPQLVEAGLVRELRA